MGEIKTTKGRDVSRSDDKREAALEEHRRAALRPPVDIYEEADAIHVLADVPGVSGVAVMASLPRSFGNPR